MKGVVIAGGSGDRMYPLTYSTNKSLLPVYDKPLIYFAISKLVETGIEDIIINTNHPDQVEALLLETKFPARFKVYLEEEALGQARVLYNMSGIIENSPILSIFGDIYIPGGICLPNNDGNSYVYVSDGYDPKRIREYAIVELGDNNQIINFEECPKKPKGHLARMGMTFFPDDLIRILDSMGDLDGKSLTDVTNVYLAQCRAKALVHNQPWFNVNTIEDLFLASQHRRAIMKKD